MTVSTPDSSCPHLQLEPGGWLHLRQPMPNWRHLSAGELLQRTQQEVLVPGRYAREAEGVTLLVEFPVDPNDGGLDATREQFARWKSGPHSSEIPDTEIIEAAVAESEWNGTFRDHAWVLTQPAEFPQEMTLRAVPGGIEVDASLVRMEELGPGTRQAVDEYLCRSQAALRFARLERTAEVVRVVARVPTELLDRYCRHGWESVAAACRMLGAEVRALASTDLAQAYLEHVVSCVPANPEAGGSDPSG